MPYNQENSNSARHNRKPSTKFCKYRQHLHLLSSKGGEYQYGLHNQQVHQPDKYQDPVQLQYAIPAQHNLISSSRTTT